MDSFTKVTVGFVTQTFEKNGEGRFVCTRQEFIAGDQCDYEDAEGNSVDPPEHEYQPYDMTLKGQPPKETMEPAMLSRAYELSKRCWRVWTSEASSRASLPRKSES